VIPIFSQGVDHEGEDLGRRLATSAQHHALRAISSYGQSGFADFYLHAGTALELAIKARLVAEGGVHCLAPDRPGWFKHAQALARDVEGRSGHRPQTATAAEALARLRDLKPELPQVFDGYVRETIDRRNVVAHAGHGAPPDDEDALSHGAAFVRAIEVLLRIDPSAFWGIHADVAASLVEDNLNAVKVRVSRQIALAREFRSRIDDEAFALVNREASARIFLQDSSIVAVPCPGCGGEGWAFGELIDDGEGETEYQDGGYHTYWTPDLYTLVDEFECQVCKLVLTGQEELEAAGLPIRVPNDRADPEEAIRYYVSDTQL
jgi:hypothetical protein